MKSKGAFGNVVAYYTTKNIYIEDEFITYVCGEYYTVVENDFAGNSDSLRSKFDNQIYKITGQAPSFKNEAFVNESKKSMKKQIMLEDIDRATWGT